MNDPHRKRLALLIRHMRGMMSNLALELDSLEAEFRDEDSPAADGEANLDQLALLVFELANDARNLWTTARRWNDLSPEGADRDSAYDFDRSALEEAG